MAEIIKNEDLRFEKNWPNPTENMLNDPMFKAIWQTIKTWDIAVPDAYYGYCGATGNHVRAILDSINSAMQKEIEKISEKVEKQKKV